MARSDSREYVADATFPDLIRRTPKTRDHRSARRPQSTLPEDAVAIIEAGERSITQAGKARLGEWLLRFRPEASPNVDPLTGWTGSVDPLTQLGILFPSRGAAVQYAERQGLEYEVREAPPARPPVGAPQDLQEASTIRLCCWPKGPHALCCGNYPPLNERGNDVEQAR